MTAIHCSTMNVFIARDASGLCRIAKALFEIELKCNPDVGQFLADPIST
jgi:hypothetical protein